MNCIGLTSITIPSSVEYIGYWIFDGCDNLKEIYSQIVEPFPLYGDIASEKIYETAILYVPDNSLEAYKACQGWNKFANIMSDDITGIKAEEPKAGVSVADACELYDINGRRLKKATRGINIIRDKNGRTSKVLIK